MAEGLSNPRLKSSLSADDIDKPSKKPGKLSAEVLGRFESDPSLSSSPGQVHFRQTVSATSTGHGSSSEIETISASHENVKSRKRANVRISVPETYESMSSNEEIFSDGEQYDKHDNKKKSRWKWSPWKKMRKFFSRKKNTKMTKSCEDLPTKHYKPVHSSKKDESSLRYRTRSEPTLPEKRPASIAVTEGYGGGSSDKTAMHTFSMLPSHTHSPGDVMRELKNRQSSSHEEVREDKTTTAILSVASMPSKAMSLPALHMAKPPLFTSGGDEGAVSFESIPSSSSLEGLQAAHDKIKAAPKHRRPPSRTRSRTSSLNSTVSPIKEVPTNHKRSNTDPQDVTTSDVVTQEGVTESALYSDVVNKTIFETTEGGEEESFTEHSTSLEVEAKPETKTETKPETKTETKMENTMGNTMENTKVEDSVMADIMERANKILSQTSGPQRLSGPGTGPRARGKASTLPANMRRAPLELRHSLKEGKSAENVVISPEEDGEKKGEKEAEKGRTKFKKIDSVKNTFSFLQNKKSTGAIMAVDKSSADTLVKNDKEAENQSLDTGKEKGVVVVKKASLTQDSPPGETAKEKETKTTSTSDSVLNGKKSWPPLPVQDDDRNVNIGEKNKPIVPFKRGKSWSSNYKPKFEETPIIIDQTKNELNKSASSKVEKSNVAEKNGEAKKAKGPVPKKSEPRFTRTKSWSPRTKAQEVSKEVEVKSKVNSSTPDTVPAAGNKNTVEESGVAPSWVAMANRASKRYSQLLQDGDSRTVEQVPIISADNSVNTTEPRTPPKPTTPTQPETTVAPKPKPGVHIQTPTSPTTTTNKKTSLESEVRARTSSHGESDKTLALNTSINNYAKNSVHELAKNSFGSAKLEKCAVCGTTVYQTEKCNFDNSVLHKQCIKCTVCNRHLTVGNFVMAESKIYCNSHGQTVTVSM